MPEPTDLTRLRREYADREIRLSGSDLYSPFNPGYLFAIQQRQRMVLAVLRKAGLAPLNNKRIMEIGCGSGGVLLEYLGFGARPQTLFGIDLLPTRLSEAHHRLPLSGLGCADGQYLPFPSAYFDLILQYTAFSSILDAKVKTNIASEMVRVLKRGGVILWYDFWLNPSNKQTRGIRPSEIRAIFPGCRIELSKITLAPPISRQIVKVSWALAQFLEYLNIFNSHYLAVIHPPA